MSRLNHPDQRFYASTYGRFDSPDPYQSGSGSGTPGDPGSWNRYAYVEGDPINFLDRHGLFEEAPDDPDPRVPGPGPQRAVKASSADPTSIAPPCNPTGNGLIETKFKFVQNNYGDTAAEAATIQSQIGNTIDTSGLTTMLLQWSANESGYGQNAANVAENNLFGVQNKSNVAGAFGGTTVACVRDGNPITKNSQNACFGSSVTWGQELGIALGITSSSTGVTYLNALESALAGGANMGQALQGIANNGWNGSPTYGSSITSGLKIQPQIDCLKKNGYI
jgi:RHS repeat-associated protein